MKSQLPKKDIFVLCFCTAFLIAGLTAIAGTGRHHAKSIICQTNLAKLSMATSMHAADNNGKLYTYGSGLYFNANDQYIEGNNNLYLCPETVPSKSNMYSWGNSRNAWSWSSGVPEAISGSYAFNGWLYDNENGQYSSNAKYYFNSIHEIKEPGSTPVYADSLWVDAWPLERDSCPADFDLNGDPNNGGYMSRYLINRHYNKTNVSFADGHAGAVELKEMWSLTWHKEWWIEHNKTRENGSPIYTE